MLTPATVSIPPARVLVADCPWSFGDKLPGDTRGAAKNYACLDVADLMRFPLPQLAPDAILFFWRVAAMQPEALDVIKAWGFTVKSEIVWTKRTKNDKAAIGMGRYVRNAHEVCLIATRGKGASLIEDHGVRSVFELEAPLGEHSAKPAEFFALVEKLVGTEGTKVELFGRQCRPGWHVFGNEIPSGYGFLPIDGEPSNAGNVQPAPAPRARKTKTLDAWDIAAAAALAAEDEGFAPAPPEARDDSGFVPKKLYTLCSICGLEQLSSPGGDTCPKGHGGASPLVSGEAPEEMGPLPVHVVPDLGEHPALTDSQTRYAFVARAEKLGILKSDSSESLDSAWVRLQYVAPPGFFREDPRAVADTSPTVPRRTIAHNPVENLGDLCGKLKEAGVSVDLKVIAGWPVNARGAAFDWVERGAPDDAVPDFITKELARQAAAAVAELPVVRGCAGCDSGIPFTKENAYKHTGEGKNCTTAIDASAPVFSESLEQNGGAIAAPKGRGRGRPRKSKGANGTNGHTAIVQGAHVAGLSTQPETLGQPIGSRVTIGAEGAGDAWARALAVANEGNADLGPGI